MDTEYPLAPIIDLCGSGYCLARVVVRYTSALDVAARVDARKVPWLTLAVLPRGRRDTTVALSVRRADSTRLVREYLLLREGLSATPLPCISSDFCASLNM